MNIVVPIIIIIIIISVGGEVLLQADSMCCKRLS